MEPNTNAAAPGMNTSTCGVCGASNKAAAKFCRQCGAVFSADSVSHRPAETSAPADKDQSRTGVPSSSDRDPEATGDRVVHVPGGATPMRVADVEPDLEAPTQEAIRPAAKGSRLGLMLGVGGAVIIVLAGLALYLTSRTEGDALVEPVTTRSGPIVEGRGNLRVEVNVPARATLDGWHLPDGGAQAASVLVFSDVEATTHTLEVWSEGYRRESSSVAIKAEQTNRVAVDLQRTP